VKSSVGERPAEILLVEDSPSDACFTQEALRRGRVKNNVHLVEDGVEALAYLRRKGQHANAPRPDLILLDISLPKKDGPHVLAEIKSDPDLRAIPVVVLTNSDEERDIVQAYSLKANCFITKPVRIEDFIEAIEAMEDFWLSIVKLPPH